ncbi:BON domain-containing protein [Oceanisphaera marina]|uniref:BON domain-containing protein n=1 Tax=Oceanisphaera marina TaxID=2017550 RepID=A0ABQ1IDY4_9GAMM|nr:division/outer membrane stress-associated lipid-binding lipoprotein [Oceanisphaera marina]GGB36628.1 BON domain-containing protein [Oceanisphaera marina]
MKPRYLLVLVPLLLLQACAGVMLAGAGTGIGSVTDRRTVGTQLSDQTIDLRATHRLGNAKPLWDDSRLVVITTNGKSLLLGQAPTEAYRQQAEDIVKGVPGVTEVFNEVRQSQPLDVTARSQDTWITSKVKSTLLAEKNLDGTKIKVVTENREVFLIGLVTQKEADISVQLARNINGVQRVITVFEFVQAAP